jgi:hypothetical protein
MAEALRQAAERQRQAEERRREELRQAAEKRLMDSAAVLQPQWQALCDAGYGTLAGYALEELGRQCTGLAGLQAGEIESRRQAAEERAALIAHAVQTLKSLGERGRAGAMAALPSIRSDEALRGAIAQTLAAGSAVESYLAVLKRARDAMDFLGACELAAVPLDAEVLAAKAVVEGLLAKPTLAAATQAERAIALLRPPYLEERLRARRDAILQGVEALSAPDRRPLLEAWREGFADALAGLRTTLGKGDWNASASTLRELDRFLDARAEGRVRLLIAAARAQGFEAVEPTKTPSSHWATSISDQTGQLFAVREAVPKWQERVELDTTLEFRGPQNYDGPACLRAGLGPIVEQLRKQGVGLRVFDEGQELMPAAPVGQVQHEVQSTAAPRRQARKLQQ